jgi:hypothetical protein
MFKVFFISNPPILNFPFSNFLPLFSHLFCLITYSLFFLRWIFRGGGGFSQRQRLRLQHTGSGNTFFFTGGFLIFYLSSMYCIQHCFICRPPSDSTVSEDAGIEPRTVATSALAVRHSNLSAKSHPQILSLLTVSDGLLKFILHHTCIWQISFLWYNSGRMVNESFF